MQKEHLPESNISIRRSRHKSPADFIRYLCLADTKRSEQARRDRSSPDFIAHCIGLYAEQRGRCALSRLEMTFGVEPRSPFQISIDKIDTDNGYTIGNVRLVTWFVGNARAELSDENLLFFARAVLEANK